MDNLARIARQGGVRAEACHADAAFDLSATQQSTVRSRPVESTRLPSRWLCPFIVAVLMSSEPSFHYLLGFLTDGGVSLWLRIIEACPDRF